MTPHIGDQHPRRVTATIDVDLSKFAGEVRQTWESIGPGEVLFLVGVTASGSDGSESSKVHGTHTARETRRELGIGSVRGCQVYGHIDLDHARAEKENRSVTPPSSSSSSSSFFFFFFSHSPLSMGVVELG